MPVVNHNGYQHAKPKKAGFAGWQKSLRIVGIATGLLLFLNVVLVLIGWGKVPANVRLGNSMVGGMSYASVQKLPSSAGIEANINLQHGTARKTMQPGQLGLAVDRQASYQKLRSSWLRWVPLASYVKHVTVPVVLKIDEAQFNNGLKSLSTQFEQAPQDVHIAFNGSQFASAPATDGYKIDAATTKTRLLGAVAAGQSDMQIPTTVVKVVTHAVDFNADIAKLNKELATQVSFATYSGTKVVPSAADRAAWYIPSGQSLAFSKERVGDYLHKIAASQKIELLNTVDLTTATYYALSHQQSLDFRMVIAGNIKRTYCTAVRGVSPSNLGELNDKLAAVYADVRGWNDQGLVGFENVASSCDYTVWLSAASQMTSFGSICDDYYNCQVGGSVVVNYDRWTTATPPWNQTGGNIEDYRVLIISHETGHRLGFLDNPVCPGAGQPAYVMMQQSIDLKGCVFNIWPTQTELAQLKTML